MFYFRDIVNLRRELRDNSNPFSMSDIIFRQFYRLSKGAVCKLIDDLVPFMSAAKNSRKIPNQIRVLTALQFYGHGSYQKIVGQDFFIPMCQSCVSVYLDEVTNAIINCLSHIISFPKSNAEITQKKNRIHDKNWIPGNSRVC